MNAHRLAAIVTLLGLAGAARAQEPEDHRGPLLEVEGMAGYTAVDMAAWAGTPNVSNPQQTAYGVNARLLLLRIGTAHAGFELGAAQVLSYEQVTQVGSIITREKHSVSASHLGMVLRFRGAAGLSYDFGFAFHYLSRSTLPGVHGAVTYHLMDEGRVSIPIGARVGMIFDENAVAMPMTFTTGIALKL